MPYRLTAAAEQQIDLILLRSAQAFGMEAALRYNLLIVAAASAVANDPERVGSRAVARVPGVRAYSLRLSRTKLVPSDRVGVPRHLIIYRVATDGVVEILGLVHDRMVLSRAARRAIRDA